MNHPKTWILLMTIALLSIFLAWNGTPRTMANEPAIYVRGVDLQETLLGARTRLEAWQPEQAEARRQVELGPWFAAVVSPEEADRMIESGSIDLDAVAADGSSLWRERPDLVDGQVKPSGFSSGQCVLLCRTVRSERPVVLTIGVGGGDQLDAWLDNTKILSRSTALTYDRYGTGEVCEGTRVDQVLTDLDLPRGESRLVVRLAAGRESSFFFSTSPDPTASLWTQIRSDFPASENPLLGAVGFEWFEPNGWFAANDTSHERALLQSLMTRIADLDADRNDRCWLDLCVKAAVSDKLGADLTALLAAVEELGALFPKEYPVVEFSARLNALAATSTPREILASIPGLQREMLVDRNPMLQDSQLLFVKRHTYNSKHYYDDYQHISAWGGNLCVLDLADGSVREIAPQLAGGVFDRYDLSFDGQRVVFGYRRPEPEGFRIHEIGIDGAGLRQLTFPPDDEQERMVDYGAANVASSFYGIGGYGFWTDDLHPCYLPDGGVCFSSTRMEHGVLCASSHYLSCTNLFRMDGDGRSLQPLSYGALSEFTPTLMEDGRILYNRWEYIYKGIAAVQSLWLMRPDGSVGREFFGDNIANPGVLWQARQVPGRPDLAVCIGCGHEPLGVGAVWLLDQSQGKRTPEAMRSLTPDVRTEGLRGIYHHRNNRWREDYYGPLYADPYPLSDKFFLVVCNESTRYNDRAGYGLFLLDTFGNRTPIYSDPEISCWQPMPLRPRTVPSVIPPTPKVKVADTEASETATVFVADVTRGLPGVEPGTVKYLRIMEQIPRPWSCEMNREGDAGPGHLAAISLSTHIWIAVMHGIVPVAADGSAHFEVPANRNIFLSALDADFMEVQRMRTFVNFLPGEKQSCVGCHDRGSRAPGSIAGSAAKGMPSRPSPQPGDTGPRAIYYPLDVQPTLDRHCVECHGGEKLEAQIDLSGEMTTLFNRSYETIIQKQLVNAIREWVESPGGSLPGGAMEHAEAVPPYTYGSHRSRLIELLREGHYDVELDREEFIRLVTWIDCNAPYYGSYFGRRNLRHKGHPDFRPLPSLESASGVPPESREPDAVAAELIGHWSFDEDLGDTTTDTSSGKHPGSIVRAQWTPEGKSGGAMRFDGTGFVHIEPLGRFDTLSVSMWVKPGDLKHTWSPLLFVDGFEESALHLSLTTEGAVNAAVHSGVHIHRRSISTVVDGSWRHIATVVDTRPGGQVRFYIDGRLDRKTPLDSTVPIELGRFRLGGYSGWEAAPNNNYHGDMDDVRVYCGMLNADQVAELSGQ